MNEELDNLNLNEETDCFDAEKIGDYFFYKNAKDDIIWWVRNINQTFGEHLFSFDKKTIFNLFRDYPQELTKEQKEIFDKENPYWANFFNKKTD